MVVELFDWDEYEVIDESNGLKSWNKMKLQVFICIKSGSEGIENLHDGMN